jgi:hypothetical protein
LFWVYGGGRLAASLPVRVRDRPPDPGPRGRRLGIVGHVLIMEVALGWGEGSVGEPCSGSEADPRIGMSEGAGIPGS